MTQRQTVLKMLKEGPKTTAEFLQAFIPRYSARILELKQEGVPIESKKVRKGSWSYWIADNYQTSILEYIK